MLNYEIDPRILAPFVPAGTEAGFLERQNLCQRGRFHFRNTRVLGIPIPFHRNFEEVNLRFYVPPQSGRRLATGGSFIRELVPRFAIAFAARVIYNEPYLALPMSHQIETNSAAYFWKFKGKENYLKVAAQGDAQTLLEGSEQEFITEHYWGYTAQRDGSTLEYRVEHPRWRVWNAQIAELHCDVAGLYGEQFCHALSRPPSSAFLAKVPEVKVHNGVKIKP